MIVLILKCKEFGSSVLQICSLLVGNTLFKLSLKDRLKALLQAENYIVIFTIFPRSLTTKPHSPEVERLISSNNILKTSKGASLALETERFYLYIHLKMPALDKWDSRSTMQKWINEK